MSNFEDRAIDYFMSKAKDKYLKGKREHGQGLDEISLPEVVDELEGEVMDLIFYTYSIKERVEKVMEAYERYDALAKKWEKE